jgi:cytochrome P450
MINGDTTQNLPYLFAVIEEGLRLFPPVPVGLQRESPGAEVDGYCVPKGTTVSVAGWTNTHSEQYFHDARGFHPERWLPEDHPLYDQAFQYDVKDASKPFSNGPRACLGINLAYMEMRIILARLVWEFDWELVSQNLDWERDTQMRLLWHKPELRVRFKPAKRRHIRFEDMSPVSRRSS